MIPLVKELNKGVANFDRNFAPDDLFNSDSRQGVRVYNSRNTWNWSTTTGTILHLAQVNNTLGAQVDIAAQATVIRKDVDDEVITDQTQLIECSGYGDRDRNSDPMVGFPRSFLFFRLNTMRDRLAVWSTPPLERVHLCP